AGAAPMATDAEVVRAAGTGAMPERGPFTVTVPGTVAGWEAVHDQGAALDWRQAFESAIAAARDGVPVARSLAGSLAAHVDLIEHDAGLAGVFTRDGRPLRDGDILRQPALAATLEALAEEGSAAL